MKELSREACVKHAEDCANRFFGKAVKIHPPNEGVLDEFKHLLEHDPRWSLEYLPRITLRPESYGTSAHPPSVKTISAKKYGIDFFPEVAAKKIGVVDEMGNFIPDSAANTMHGEWIALDNRPKPAYLDGRQMYEDDYILGAILKKIRSEGKLDHSRPDWLPPASRFFVSWDDWLWYVRPELAHVYNLPSDRVRLLRAIEWSYLGNALYPQWGETVTCEWLEDSIDVLEGGRLSHLWGGHFQLGGLSYITRSGGGYRWHNLGFRPIVILNV